MKRGGKRLRWGRGHGSGEEWEGTEKCKRE